MRCSAAHIPDNSIFHYAVENERRGCELVKQAAAFVGLSSWDVSCLCDSAKTVTGYNRKEKVRYVRYSSAVRCPLLSAVIAAAAARPVPAKIVSTGVYTVGMAAAALDMSRSAVRKAVKSGRLAGFADKGGYLITGAALLRFVSGCCVLGAGRRGAVRSSGIMCE